MNAYSSSSGFGGGVVEKLPSASTYIIMLSKDAVSWCFLSRRFSSFSFCFLRFLSAICFLLKVLLDFAIGFYSGSVSARMHGATVAARSKQQVQSRSVELNGSAKVHILRRITCFYLCTINWRWFALCAHAAIFPVQLREKEQLKHPRK